MRIAVTSTGPTIEHYVGRTATHCGYLLIVDPETMQYEALQNPVVALRGPAAGKLFAQILLESQAKTILVGGCDSGGLEVLRDAGIPVFNGITGSVRGAVERFKCGCCLTTARELWLDSYGDKRTAEQ